MRYLLDTNIVSELRKKTPNHRVKDWVAKAHINQIYISCLTIGEIKLGILKLEKKDKVAAKAIQKWLEELTYQYSEQILSIDLETTEEWAKLMNINGNHIVDNLIAAQSIQNNMTIVTRNTKDYVACNVKLLNPFNEDSRDHES